MNSLPANIAALTNSLERTREFAAAGASKNTYIKMNKGGVWTIGKQEEEVFPATQWAVNLKSFMTGYSAFDKNNNRVGEEMVTCDEPALKQSDLPDVGHPWGRQIGFEVVCVKCAEEPDDVGRTGYISQRSKGGLSAGLELLTAIIDKIRACDEVSVAIVELTNISYKHTKYGTIYSPKFEVCGWANEDTNDIEEVQAAPADKPKRGGKTSKPKAIEPPAEEAAEEAAEETQPVRRRGRKKP